MSTSFLQSSRQKQAVDPCIAGTATLLKKTFFCLELGFKVLRLGSLKNFRPMHNTKPAYQTSNVVEKCSSGIAQGFFFSIVFFCSSCFH